ncbi:phage integrase central domain-containing protein [Agrobacterium vaccinii]|uniref:phage integrase central domain-containing protein n=1 Tax=Agrobacterium vaccinii TaxID=2735528 RepID=UPI003BB0A886
MQYLTLPVTQITSRDVPAMLTSIDRRGHVESALATRAAISCLFLCVIATAMADNNPSSSLRGAPQRHVAVSHAAFTTKAEISGLMRAIYGY